MWSWPSAPDHAPPFDPWAAALAWQQTWLAGLDPAGAGRQLRAQRLAALLTVALRDSPLYARRSRGARVLADIAPIGKAELTLGKMFSLPLGNAILAAQKLGQRYLGVQYTVATGPLTAGKFTCHITLDAVHDIKSYASGFTVA